MTVAVVTGGGRGIGAAICAALAKAGHSVWVVDRDAEPAYIVAEAVGGRAVVLDVANAEQVISVLGESDARILVNNAGYDEFSWFTDVRPQDWRRLLAVNLEGVFACTQAVLPAMQRAKHGRIVNVASEAGRLGSKGNAVYAASKGGVIAFGRSIARENARFNITVNTICPGPDRHPIVGQGARARRTRGDHGGGDDRRHRIGSARYPRRGRGAVAFLCSAEAGYITGETIGVSGGMGIGC